MAWTKVANVAQYKGASWDNLVKRTSGTTPEEAQRIADEDPTITFFFYARQPMFLEGNDGPDGWSEKGRFNPGDAVFFSGEPWLGSAPQCDVYQKEEATPTYARKSVWANGGTFDDPILRWYAIGVQALMARPITDRTSWRFLAAMHEFQKERWIQVGALTVGEELPSASDRSTFWEQCQHSNWFFLPWHRGYLLSLEGLVRAAIEEAGGPSDWALPYWDYDDPVGAHARDLPPAFSQKTMKTPAGEVPNPLFVERRFGARDGGLPLPADHVKLTALDEDKYAGVKNGAGGFGGVESSLDDPNPGQGALENLPHNWVHGDIGGGGGLMSSTLTAGLDPIFYLHHANIDRLWMSWNQTHQNPSDDNWVNGPTYREFTVPRADGSAWSFKSKDMLPPNLNYEYSDLGEPRAAPSQAAQRKAKLESFSVAPTSPMPSPDRPDPELIGSNEEPLTLRDSAVSTRVRVASSAATKMGGRFESFLSATESVPVPDRVFLNLESITSEDESVSLDVYVRSASDPSGDRTLAGSVSLFGVSAASDPERGHGGNGLTRVVEITDTVDTLHLGHAAPGLSDLEVEIVPRSMGPDTPAVRIGQVTLFRHA